MSGLPGTALVGSEHNRSQLRLYLPLLPYGGHAMSGTLITTPFGPASTAAEVIAGVDLTGKRAIVTGASSGIGQETARALAGAGAEVTLAVRDTAAGEKAAAAIAGSEGNPRASRRAAGPGGPRLGRRVRRRLAGPAAHPGQQRRDHGHPRAAHARGMGAAVRHQPPRPLRPDDGAARRPRGGGRRPGRRGQLGRPRQRRGAVRRRELRAAPLQRVGRLQPVQDRERALRRRGGQAVGRGPASR